VEEEQEVEGLERSHSGVMMDYPRTLALPARSSSPTPQPSSINGQPLPKSREFSTPIGHGAFLLLVASVVA
jgi:hypothetical protein